MNKEQELLKNCVDYFKNTSGFKRTMLSIRKKYESLGILGGTVVLSNLKDDEKEALTGLFRKDYFKKSVSFKVEAFIKAIEATKFQGVVFETVLEEYFGESMISNKEGKLIYLTEKQLYFSEIAENFKDTRAKQWILFFLESKENAYRIISQKYDENKELLSNQLMSVCRAYNALSFNENNSVRLAMFSSIITKNPHSFDTNTECGNLLVAAICYSLKVKYPENAEELSEVLYRAGIIKDEVSNHTLCSGVLAYNNNQEHAGWRGFYEQQEPLQPSLWNISKVDKVISPQGKVYVFENPTVFSEVLNRIGYRKPSLLCTLGNFKLASLLLIDKLVNSGAQIYYSGDFDPEGIVMADKLKQRHCENIVLWRYTEENYFSIKSSVEIEAFRIKKMDNIKSEELKNISEVIRKNKCAAYQELLIDRYVEDILGSFK